MDKDICNEYIGYLNEKIVNREPVYKTQCQITFKDAFSRNGLYLNLKNLDAYCEDYLEWNSSLTGCKLYLNIQGRKEFQVENIKNPTNISIEKEGGYFFGNNIIKELYTYSVLEMPSKSFFQLGNTKDVPIEFEEKLKYIIQYDLNNDFIKESDSSSATSSWSEERKVSKYSENLFQVTDPKKVPSSGWECERCSATTNLWLNLSDGYIGCGRKLYGVGGGCFDGKEEGAALLHYKEHPERPLVVKLGTITQFGTADVFSYDPNEDDLVLDPNLVKHLSTFGINVGVLEKTEKNLTELQIEHNNKLDFRSNDRSDYYSDVSQCLVPLEKIGIRQYFVGIENAGNTCYINVVLQLLSGIPEVRKLFVDHFKDILNSYSIYFSQKLFPRNNPIIQFSKVMNALVSNDIYADRKYKIDKYILDVTSAKNKLIGNNVSEDIIESVFGTETDYNYINILPLVFKKTISCGNPEFSSSHQQDTQEYFSFLIDKLREKLQELLKSSSESKHEELIRPIKDFLSLFSFTHIELLECKQTGKVKLINSRNNFISLSIPNHLYSAADYCKTMQTDRATHSPRMLKKQRQDDPDSSKNGDPVSDSYNHFNTDNKTPIIDLKFLLENWKDEEIIDHFMSPCTNTIGKAGKSNHLKNMPKYLVIQIKRFYLSQDWKPQKIVAKVDAPEFLDIEFLRRSDSLYDYEFPFPNDTDLGSCSLLSKNDAVGDKTRDCGVQHAIPESLTTSILDLGFSKKHAELAVRNTGTTDLDICINWILSNVDNLESLEHANEVPLCDNDNGSLIPSEKKVEVNARLEDAKDSPNDLSEDLIQNVMSICCCLRATAIRALRLSNNDLERAVQILFDDPSVVEDIIDGEEAEKQGIGTVRFGDASLDELNSIESDGEGKYELVGVICHLGNSVHSGHYVCYLKRNINLCESDIQLDDSGLEIGENRRWFKFNDSKISLCKDKDLLQKENGYMYIYRRI